MDKFKKVLAWIISISMILFITISLIVVIIHEPERLISLVISIPLMIILLWSMEEVRK